MKYPTLTNKAGLSEVELRSMYLNAKVMAMACGFSESEATEVVRESFRQSLGLS